MRVLLTDTETGGFKKPLTPIEVAGIYINSAAVQAITRADNETFQQRFKPSQPMEFGAIAVHNILPSELENEPAWRQEIFKGTRLRGVTFLVGHNIDFDAEVLGGMDIRRIDTLALSRHWAPDADSHKLSAMVYYLFGCTDETRQGLKNAHSALADLHNTARVLWALIQRFGQGINNWEELYEVSELGRVPYRFTFGKYGPKDGKQGMRIRDFVSEARANSEFRSYMGWLRREFKDDKYLMQALDKPK